MESHLWQRIEKPTLVLDERKAHANLKRMAAKAAAAGVRFRPHFKTHQSALIGEWFREEGVTAITVSSLSMAEYFAGHGWDDILVAFPVNVRELAAINHMAGRVRLGLLLESIGSVNALQAGLTAPVDVWIKIDTGLHRAGLDVNDVEAVRVVAEEVVRSPRLRLRGLLTHAGQTYHAHSQVEIREMYAQSCCGLAHLRQALASSRLGNLEISVGDSPGCTLSDDLGEVDEIRPGNFIFFDSMMFDLGVCTPQEIAVVVACPVVALHAQRLEAVVYGGAIHLSKESLQRDCQSFYGYAALPDENGWRFIGRENHVLALSQEHGVIQLTQEYFSRLKVGDLLCVLPVHSCLAVDALGIYLTLQGEKITTMLS